MDLKTFVDNYNREEELMSLSFFAKNPELKKFVGKYHGLLEQETQAQSHDEPEVA